MAAAMSIPSTTVTLVHAETYTGDRLHHSLTGTAPNSTQHSIDRQKVPSARTTPSVKPYECNPIPSSLTPNHDQAVTMLPPRARIARPRSLTSLSQRACSTSAFHRTMISAPFSLGSQPQNRPHESSAHRPPSTVPTNDSMIAKQVTP